MYHHLLTTDSSLVAEWRVENALPFQELLVSWNAFRPQCGYYAVDVAILDNAGWSSWLPYAEWGVNSQRGFVMSGDRARVNLDLVETEAGHGFRVRIRAEACASLDGFRALHVCTKEKRAVIAPPLSSIHLTVPPLSQMALSDPRSERLCSPSSLTVVLRFLAPQNSFNPLQIADRVWDESADIYGNWILNIAEAYAQLGGDWFCWAERLSRFEEIQASLHQGIPMVVSVRGPLSGSARPYTAGHLLVVKGYDAENKQVLCMDPGFETDAKTHVAYPLDEFITAWQRRDCLAYVFAPASYDFT